MTNTELDEIRTWFHGQVQTYASPGGKLPALLQLKVNHSERVARDSRLLAREMQWTPTHVNCAEAIGWLHDVGRFSQFAEFGTFSDRRSVDHGQRGWDVLKESNALKALSDHDVEAILTSVRYHNARTIADGFAAGAKPFLDLVRDADKLDIFRIVQESIERDGFQELPEMLPQVQLDGRISPVLLEELKTHQCASLEHVRSLSDFLLMQLSWVYDLNYSSTFRRMMARDVVSNIARQLPRGDGRVERVVRKADRFVRDRT